MPRGLAQAANASVYPGEHTTSQMGGIVPCLFCLFLRQAYDSQASDTKAMGVQVCNAMPDPTAQMRVSSQQIVNAEMNEWDEWE